MAAAAATPTHQGILRFGVPDQSVSVEERGLYAFPANKDVKEFEFELRDARTAPEILPGLAGLDAQGFAYVKHKSALQDSNAWLTGDNAEKIYIPEIQNLVCKVTGAKHAVVMDASFRLKPADDQIQLDWYRRRDDPIDVQLAKLPKNVTAVFGRENGATIEPARQAHIDYTCQGLRDTARYRRRDIYELCKKTMQAEDAVARGEDVKVPKYAAFSVWRPLETVRRDPIAVCDSRSVKASDFAKVSYRAVSDITENSEYHLEAAWLSPPDGKSTQRWYWLPEQHPDEVLLIKFADTESEVSPSTSFGCAHLSPRLLNADDEETRRSVECRVLAFWDE